MQRLVWVALAGAAALAGQGQPSPQELIDAGHYKRARALVESRNTKDADTLYFMATLKQMWHDLDAAEKYAEQAVAANPKDARCHYRLSDISGERAQDAGPLKQISLGRKFKKECDTALSLDPNHTGALFNLMQYYLHAPGLIGGDKSKAAGVADQIMKLDPRKGYQAKLEIARVEKQTKAVEELNQMVLKLQPESFEGHLTLANYLAGPQLKKYAEAEEHARAAIAIYPDRAGGHGALAVMLVRQNKLGELDPALAQAEKAVPDNLHPYFRAANNLLDLKVDLPRAERYFRKYLSQEPEPVAPTHSQTHWRLGLVLELEGRKQDAVVEWQAAVRLDGNSPAKQELKRAK